MIRKTIFLIISVLAFAVSANASSGGGGSSTTYYSKLTVKTSDSALGKVYVSKDQTNNPQYAEESSATNDGSSKSQTYYLYAQPEDGFVLDYWATSSGQRTASNDTYTIQADSEDEKSPSFETLTAYFIERPPITVHSNNLSLGTASITKGTNQVGSSLTVTAAFVYTVPKGDYWNCFSKSVKFDGWYDQDDNLKSTDLVYSFTVKESADLTAKFSWTPFITKADGYYHVRSAIGTRGFGYINVISDYAPSFSLSNRTLKGSMEMVMDNTYTSDPATVIRITGTGYTKHETYTSQTTILKSVELIGQGISTKTLTGNTFELRTGDQQGFYKLYYSRANLYNEYNGQLTLSSDQTGTSNEIMRLFDFEPLDEAHIDEFYFGAQPDEDMLFDGGYWTSMYTAFPYQCWEEDGVEAYYVKSNGVSIDGETVILEKIEGGIVPANTAVLLKCKSLDPSGNRLLPLLDDGDPIEDNLLEGSLQLNSKSNDKSAFASATMRVLDVKDGEVGFYIIDEGTELIANKAWLNVGNISAKAKIRFRTDTSTFVEGISINTPAEDENAPIYNLQGVIIKNPIPGQIYIKNGKKFVAR